MNRILGLLLLLPSLLLSSCDEPFAPKPRGYFRISLPEKAYTALDLGGCPFTFEVPGYAAAVRDTARAEACWYNIEYRPFNGTLYLSYKPVADDLQQLTTDCRNMAMKHVTRASGIDEQTYSDPAHLVYGLEYDFKGGSASPLQFWLTDSTHHFIRGSLYFYAVPNPDSIAPVLDFIRADVRHMIETFRWK